MGHCESRVPSLARRWRDNAQGVVYTSSLKCGTERCHPPPPLVRVRAISPGAPSSPRMYKHTFVGFKKICIYGGPQSLGNCCERRLVRGSSSQASSSSSLSLTLSLFHSKQTSYGGGKMRIEIVVILRLVVVGCMVVEIPHFSNWTRGGGAV